MIQVFLEDENGAGLAEVVDGHGVLLGGRREDGYSELCCLRFIDTYGDTVFNYLQMPTLLNELDWLRGKVSDSAEIKVIEDTRNLAIRCRDAVGMYLKFYGD